ncbi:MAG: N-acetylneuraminate synthase family protein [Balneolaceae bacterium]|nr:N-acetylneuraminate synthase family protein [Balneolaceae bacterium]
MLVSSGCEEPELLHCTSAYPHSPYREANLAAIATLRERTGCRIGWSDHTVEPAVIYRAVHRWKAGTVEAHLDLEGEGAEYGGDTAGCLRRWRRSSATSARVGGPNGERGEAAGPCRRAGWPLADGSERRAAPLQVGARGMEKRKLAERSRGHMAIKVLIVTQAGPEIGLEHLHPLAGAAPRLRERGSGGASSPVRFPRQAGGPWTAFEHTFLEGEWRRCWLGAPSEHRDEEGALPDRAGGRPESRSPASLHREAAGLDGSRGGAPRRGGRTEGPGRQTRPAFHSLLYLSGQ